MLQSTLDLYAKIVSEATAAGAADAAGFLSWLRGKAREDASVGTFLPRRAAIRRHLLTELRLPVDEVDEQLQACVGLPVVSRRGLSQRDLAVFRSGVSDSGSAYRALSFVLGSGCSAGEVSRIRKNDLRTEQRLFIPVGKRNKARTIVLSDPAWALLDTNDDDPEALVFRSSETAMRKALSRVAARAEAAGTPLEEPISVGRLRHTFAEARVAEGWEPKMLARHLGLTLDAVVRYYE